MQTLRIKIPAGTSLIYAKEFRGMTAHRLPDETELTLAPYKWQPGEYQPLAQVVSDLSYLPDHHPIMFVEIEPLDLHLVQYRGVAFLLTAEHYDALCDYGADVASQSMTGEEATFTVLVGAGYDVTAPWEGGGDRQ